MSNILPFTKQYKGKFHDYTEKKAATLSTLLINVSSIFNLILLVNEVRAEVVKDRNISACGVNAYVNHSRPCLILAAYQATQGRDVLDPEEAEAWAPGT